MPWTKTTREQYQRGRGRFASELTEGEWAQLEPLLPPPHRLGRPRKRSLRPIVEAILYMAWTGVQWRALPREFPPFATVQNYFYAWRNNGLLQKIVGVLVRRTRRALGRADEPTAAVIDSQSAPTSHGGPRGYDAGKRVRGRKRHIVTDTNGLMLAVDVHPANIQDCHGAVPLLTRLRQIIPICNMCLQTASIAASNCGTPSQPVDRGRSRSSSASKDKRASSFCRDAGSSSAPSHGLPDHAGSPATSNAQPKARPHGS